MLPGDREAIENTVNFFMKCNREENCPMNFEFFLSFIFLTINIELECGKFGKNIGEEFWKIGGLGALKI